MKNNKQQEIERLTELDIKDRIIQFNLDSSIDELKRYYATPSTWEIIKKSRSETCHTQFLAWLFGNKDFNADPNTGPIKRLIVLLLKWVKDQETPSKYFTEELANSIYSQQFSVESYEVESESPIFIEQDSDEPAYGDGNIDILIHCKTKISGKDKNVNIVIENKIEANETIKCFNKEGEQLKKPNIKNTALTLYQTQAYYQYITKQHKNDINIFVYLKPSKDHSNELKRADCNCDRYIPINYQEILDDILQPISEQKDISEENRFKLKDYIKALGKPSDTQEGNEHNTNKKTTIMAMEQKEKELLATFFANNEDLIRAAIESLDDKDLSESMAKVESKAPRYTISNMDGIFTMYQVLEEFIKFRLSDKTLKIKDLDEEIRGFIGKTDKVKVSDDEKIPVEREGEKSIGSFEFEGHKIRYSKQWSDNGTYPTFTRFREGVNRKYSNSFKIERI